MSHTIIRDQKGLSSEVLAQFSDVPSPQSAFGLVSSNASSKRAKSSHTNPDQHHRDLVHGDFKEIASPSSLTMPVSGCPRQIVPISSLTKSIQSHKSFRTKQKLAKAQKQNRPIPQWIRLRTGNTIRYVLASSTIPCLMPKPGPLSSFVRLRPICRENDQGEG